MKFWHLACATMALGVACNSTDEGSIPTENAEGSGTLQLALIGTDSKGNQYRLRNGEFFIEGYPDYFEGAGGAGSYFSESVSTEDDPNAPTIRKRVLPGYYYVNFVSEDWFFEKLTPGGPEPVEKAVLLSNRYTYGYVYDGSVTNFSYQFGVEGDLIDFRSGDINIRIGIEHPDDNEGGSAGVGGVSGAGGAAW